MGLGDKNRPDTALTETPASHLLLSELSSDAQDLRAKRERRTRRNGEGSRRCVLAETTIQACSISAGFHRLALVRLAAIALLLVLCLAHAAQDLPVPPALPFAICVLWTVFAACYWALQRAGRRQEARPPPTDKGPWRRHWDGPGALSARTVHELSTPISTMLLVVGELRRSSGMPPPDWNESVDTLWTQLQLCKRALNAAAHPEDLPRRYIDSGLVTSVTFESGEQG
jgi:hypothetical protein